jgi:hypothetical protein
MDAVHESMQILLLSSPPATGGNDWGLSRFFGVTDLVSAAPCRREEDLGTKATNTSLAITKKPTAQHNHRPRHDRLQCQL